MPYRNNAQECTCLQNILLKWSRHPQKYPASRSEPKKKRETLSRMTKIQGDDESL